MKNCVIYQSCTVLREAKYKFFVGFEVSKVIFIFFLIGSYILFITNRKNIKLQVKKSHFTIIYNDYVFSILERNYRKYFLNY